MISGFVKMLLIPTLILSAENGFAQTTAPTRPSSATVQKVSQPKKPSLNAPTASGAPLTPPAAAGVSAVSAPRGAPSQLITEGYNDAAFKKANDAGLPVILIFSETGDAIWNQQISVLSVVLRDPGYSRIPSFQIDMTNKDLAEKFLVKSAGTILVYKSGVERLRSTRMIKADVVRKMLNLSGSL